MLLGLIDSKRPWWHRHGACRRAPLDATWFPDRGENAVAAKAICAGCPVLEPCREWALSQGATLDGVWGGLSRAERLDLRSVRT